VYLLEILHLMALGDVVGAELLLLLVVAAT
jgi:UPF0716 family protein affecting phage T7 exclusion